MKKLMIAAVAAATVGGAFAAPFVYDYKASVKHTYLKEYAAKDLYLKTQKTSSLKGYLIQDADGETAKAVVDVQPYNRCYLVVKNGSAESKYRFVRIVPGIIEASWYTTKALVSNQQINKTYTGSLTAQGYLYLGGDVTSAYVGSTFSAGSLTESEWNANLTSVARSFVASLQGRLAVPTFGIDDYFFTSCYLFGQFNQPDWNYDAVDFAASGYKYRYFFADAWMNGAGFGKASYSSTIGACCGKIDVDGGFVLDTLSGNLKAGLYLCSVSGSDIAHAKIPGWDDQLWAEAGDGVDANGDPILVKDTWADGNLDLGTTDVGFGTWSIKRNTKLAGVDIKDADLADGVSLADCGAKVYPFIKAAAQALDKNVVLFGSPLSGAVINLEFHNAYLKK